MGRTVVASVALILAFGTIAAGGGSGKGAPDVDLDEILEQLAELAEHYRARALSFTADETTKVLSYYGYERKAAKHTSTVNVYVYQRSTDGTLTDRRIRKRDRRKLEKRLERSEEVDSALTVLPDPMRDPGIPFYVVRPYSWIFLFSDDAQERYRYAVEEIESHRFRPAVRISFRPATSMPFEEDWFGSALIDLETLHLLYAEGFQTDDYRTKLRMEAELASPAELPAAVEDRTYMIRHVATEFHLEKQGLRLPTKVRSEATRYIVRGLAESKKLREQPYFEVIQKFDNYRFFEIRTEESRYGVPSGP